MACYHPIQGWKGPDGEFSLSRRSDLLMTVSCGRCTGCRLERSRQWAVRIMHEVQMHEENSYVTLTYDNELDEDGVPHLPYRGMLNVRDFQLFMKRLRKFYKNERISFFHCGEYGEENYRPHYHAILFGVWFPDCRVRKHNERGEPLYESPALTRLWGKGDCLVGAVTFDSARYVAKYCTAVVNGEKAKEHYRRLDESTGELYWVPPEYATMSLKPAIGKRWFEQFGAEVEDNDSVVMSGHEMPPPRYYDKLRDREVMKEVKKKRVKKMLRNVQDITAARLKVREKAVKGRLSAYRRSL